MEKESLFKWKHYQPDLILLTFINREMIPPGRPQFS